MLCTNYYYGCCKLFQTTIKNCKVPHLKSTDPNRIQVTTFTCCSMQVKQHYCTILATAAGNCAVINVTYNENNYYVVICTVYCLSRVLNVSAPTPVTTSYGCKVPHLKSTDLNRIQVTNVHLLQHTSQTALLHHTGYCHR